MYYEDENNLYHYSYRKGDTNVTEPVYNTRNYAEEPAPAQQPKKSRIGMKLVALALVCSLLGGAVGAGAMSMVRASANTRATAINVSERETTEVETVAVSSTRKMSFAELYKANVNSVVSINTTVTKNIFNQTVQNASAGSGFIITEDGYIVTNYHVVDSASTVKVTLYNGETYEAEIIGGDEDYDIAVVKIDATGLQAVTLGSSSKLNIGEDVAAIGNPLGQLTFSINEGIVSSMDRAINIDGTPFNMIQISVAINPGNSGGPLFNTYGEVVGIVSAKWMYYSSDTIEGVAFAIPIDDVIAMVEDIMENGRVTTRPYFGVTISTVNANFAQQNGLAVSSGMYVNAVDAGGASEKAGVKAGDVIVRVGDRAVTNMTEFNAAKKTLKAGDTTTLTVNRGGTETELTITLDTEPEAAQTPEQPQQNPNNYPNNYYYYNDNNNNNGGYYDPWSFFDSFFGNQYGGRYYGGN